MSATLSKCFRCGSTAIESRPVEELVRRGPYVVALRLMADVCATCGERCLQRSDVSTIEDVRRRLDRGELAGFRVTGELLGPVGDDAIEVEAEPFELTPEEEAELAESIREADRGEVVTAEEVLARLSR